MAFLILSVPSIFFLILVIPLAESITYWGDVEALKLFKNGLEPNSLSPGSCLSSWDFTFDPCDNLFSDKFTCGFRCDLFVSGTSRVTELALDPAGYAGSLTPSFFNLPYLETLDLSNNFFSGTIPDFPSNMTRLRRVALSENSFSGEIPASIGSISSLEELYLDNNNLQGQIPARFDNLLSLKRLEVQSNELSGEFTGLDSLNNLYILNAGDNLISGSIPENLPASLVVISMRNNSLIGTIPQCFKNMNSLQVIDLSYNQLGDGDSVPAFIFEHPSLQQLTLSFNKFTAIETPASLGIQSELIAIDLNENLIGGLLPTFMASMPKLSALSLENNRLTGMIPTEYALRAAIESSGEVSPFARLLLGGNYLFGAIPKALMGLKAGSVNVRIGDNCLYRCPMMFFFCQGGRQKSIMECKSFGTVIP